MSSLFGTEALRGGALLAPVTDAAAPGRTNSSMTPTIPQIGERLSPNFPLVPSLRAASEQTPSILFRFALAKLEYYTSMDGWLHARGPSSPRVATLSNSQRERGKRARGACLVVEISVRGGDLLRRSSQVLISSSSTTRTLQPTFIFHLVRSTRASQNSNA